MHPCLRLFMPARWLGLLGMVTLLLGVVFSASFWPTAVAQAQQPLPQLRYASSSNTVYIGRPYDPNLPAEAPYVGYPSHPNAPKLAMTLPQLAAALNKPHLIADQGNGVWLVKVNLVVEQNARLNVVKSTTAPLVSELRLESYPTSATTKKFVKVVAKGGQILLQDIKVHSWNTLAGTVDTDYNYGRSYLAALYGAKMDLLRVEAAYLGWYEPNPNFPEGKVGKGEPSGLSWRFWATPSNRQTGATGSIVDSLIHHNYYGNYTYQASNMVFTGNKVYSNAYYGFDPHDYSSNMVIAYNEFYNNGYHGLILSRGCTNSVIHHNKIYNNAGHGFMLDRGSNNNQVYDNEIYGNQQDGIAIYASSSNVFTNNISRDNVRYGLRIHATYDAGDIYDGLALDNVFAGNTFTGNGKYGINLYERADRNTFTNNTVSNNALYNIYIATGINRFEGNIVTGGTRDGIYVIGSPPYSMTNGVTTPVPPVSKPGYANVLKQNTVRGSTLNGIALYKGATGNSLTGNLVESNIQHGIYLKDSTTVRNLVSQNSISANSRDGIKLDSSANAAMPKPTITRVVGTVVSGTARAGAKVEVYRDLGGEGKVYKGVATASSSGAWSLTLPVNDNPAQGPLTATARDSQNNTSPFSTPFGAVQAAAPDAVEDLFVTDELFAAEVAENQAAAQEDMQPQVDPDYSETLAELERLEAEGGLSQQLFLPLIVQE
jgi:parallel beta-helix repeat protein